MRSAAAIVAAGALVAVGSASGSGVAAKPALSVIGLQPLTLQGRNFEAGERVRVEALGKADAPRRVVAARTGSFTVRFSSVVVSRCEAVRAIATGGAGSRASLKYLPLPLCKPDLRPGGKGQAQAG